MKKYKKALGITLLTLLFAAPCIIVIITDGWLICLISIISVAVSLAIIYVAEQLSTNKLNS
jgi:hypothetical protein